MSEGRGSKVRAYLTPDELLLYQEIEGVRQEMLQAQKALVERLREQGRISEHDFDLFEVYLKGQPPESSSASPSHLPSEIKEAIERLGRSALAEWVEFIALTTQHGLACKFLVLFIKLAKTRKERGDQT